MGSQPKITPSVTEISKRSAYLNVRLLRCPEPGRIEQRPPAWNIMQLDAAVREHLVDTLRNGTVPQLGLGDLAVGLESYEEDVDEILAKVAAGSAKVQGVRGEYGEGKSFFKAWVAARARSRGFASSWVYINPALKLTNSAGIYREVIRNLAINSTRSHALSEVIDAWFHGLRRDARAEGAVDPTDDKQVSDRVLTLARARLDEISGQSHAYAEALIQYKVAQSAERWDVMREILAWLSGTLATARVAQGKATATRRSVLNTTDPLKDLLPGLLALLRDCGFAGLVLVLDEVATVAELPAPERKASLGRLQTLVDLADMGAFPGLYVLFSGTPAFFDGPKGVKDCPPLAKRLETRFAPDPRFDSRQMSQIRLPRYGDERLVMLGRRVRDIYCAGQPTEARIRAKVTDQVLRSLADSMVGQLGNAAGIAPRLFLKTLIGSLLDQAKRHEDFDPLRHAQLTLSESEMTPEERAARQQGKPTHANSPDDLVDLPE